MAYAAVRGYLGLFAAVLCTFPGSSIVVEAKMASSSLTDKKIGEQLIVDIERYKAHPDCDKLVCLVYDPNHHIRNPIGLEKDLARKEEKLEVLVVVVPK